MTNKKLFLHIFKFGKTFENDFAIAKLSELNIRTTSRIF